MLDSTRMKTQNMLCVLIFLSVFIVLLQYQIYSSNNSVPTVQFEEVDAFQRFDPKVIAIKNDSRPNNVTHDRTNKVEKKPVEHVNGDQPPVYIITPTYRRAEQLAEITRLSQTLMHVKNMYWIVVEDAVDYNPLVREILVKSGINFQHLLAPMPVKYKNKKGPKPRGVSNRNKGLAWVRQNARSGALYFADDDNAYDIQLFEEIRMTKRVSMFPVGLITNLGVSSPVVKNGTFVDFYDGWPGGRKFPVDMAGFAVGVEFLLSRPNAIMPFEPGYEEDGFLKSLEPFEVKEIELLADNCTKILVWHTQSHKNNPSKPLDMKKYNNTNLILLKKIIV